MKVLTLFLLSTVCSWAQVTGGLFETEELMKDQAKSQALSSQIMQKQEYPVGNTVDPEHYIVGPGDVLSIQLLPLMLSDNLVMLSPSNTIVLPKFGLEFNLNGNTLSDAKQQINDTLKARNIKAKAIVALQYSRLCLVTIEGNVQNPGSYSLPASYKVSTAIKVADSYLMNQQLSIIESSTQFKIEERRKRQDVIYSESGIPYEKKYATRNITLLRNDGSSYNVDIEKSRVTNSYKLDPYISQGDIIHVPFDKSEYETVSISGEVHRPVVLPYKFGDKLSEVVKFAYGLKETADIENIRYVSGSENIDRKIRCDQNLNLLSEDIEVSPGAMILVGKKAINTAGNFGVVSISGQVQKPGVYHVSSGNTQLRELIDKAGGFTQDAYLPLAKIYRRHGADELIFNPDNPIKEYYRLSDLILEDTTRFNMSITMKDYIVSANMSNYSENSPVARTKLYDGDVIIVPSNPGKVYVFGMVNNPGFVEFAEGRNMEWYIEKAGGYASAAEESRARIIRGINKTWVEGDDDVFVYAGDEIYIPGPPDIPEYVNVQKYSFYTSLVGSLSGIVGLILTIISISTR